MIWCTESESMPPGKGQPIIFQKSGGLSYREALECIAKTAPAATTLVIQPTRLWLNVAMELGRTHHYCFSTNEGPLINFLVQLARGQVPRLCYIHSMAAEGC